jgi:DNA polymerase
MKPAQLEIKKRFDDISREIMTCERCMLCQSKRNYVPGVMGDSYYRVVFIGEAPGAMEDIAGEPFRGRAGGILTTSVEKLMGLKRDEYSILNTIKCRPPENREPSADEKNKCRPWLMKQLQALDVSLIITLGTHAAQTLLQRKVSLNELREYWFTDTKTGIDMVPTFHPMATSYVKARKMLFERDLLSMCKTSSGMLSREYREVRNVQKFSLSIGQVGNIML